MDRISHCNSGASLWMAEYEYEDLKKGLKKVRKLRNSAQRRDSNMCQVHLFFTKLIANDAKRRIKRGMAPMPLDSWHAFSLVLENAIA